MRKSIIAAITAVLTLSGFSTPMPASASKILLNMSDMVLLSRGIADSEYDLNHDGVVNSADLNLGLRYLSDRALNDCIRELPEAWQPQYYDFCENLARETKSVVFMFSDYLPQDYVPYQKGLIIERVFSVVDDDGRHGRIISMLEPYYTAIGYDRVFEPGSVVMTLFVYRGGSRFEEIDSVVICSEDFSIGTVSDYMEGGFL